MEIHTPITEEVRRSLKAGQLVEITGEIRSEEHTSELQSH